jgi:CheY-like chemotaxis protein
MKKILIIEDELAYSKLLNDQLASRSYKIITAYDGQEGLAKAKKEKPDLILLDIRMPKMDGLTMLKILRKDTKGKKIKTILLTNLEPDETIVHKVVDDQPAYYFVKSDTKLEDLIKKIDELLDE